MHNMKNYIYSCCWYLFSHFVHKETKVSRTFVPNLLMNSFSQASIYPMFINTIFFIKSETGGKFCILNDHYYKSRGHWGCREYGWNLLLRIYWLSLSIDFNILDLPLLCHNSGSFYDHSFSKAAPILSLLLWWSATFQ